MIRDGDAPEVCRKCSVPHVENCDDCFGFGFWNDGTVVTAGEARRLSQGSCARINGYACPLCGGTARGVPDA